MQCAYCGKQAYVTHICPYCKGHYCLGHREPKGHDCSSYKRLYESDSNREESKSQPLTTKMLQKPAILSAVFEGAQKKFFAASFTLVVVEEILRLISYAKNSPLLAYLDGNTYVEILYQSMTPYIASVMVFLFVCFILFGTRRFASKNQNTNNSYVNLLKGVIPLGIFTAISIAYLFSIANWLFILTS